MTLEEMKQTDWYKTRPKVIKDLICQYPYASTVKIKPTGQIAYVYSWFEDGTLSVVINQEDNPCNAVSDGVYRVFGYRPDDLEFIQENPDIEITEK